jgi:hypothetical protein
MGGHVARLGEMRNMTILVVKPEVRTATGRPNLRQEDNIRMGLKEGEYEVMDHLDQDRDQLTALVNTVMHLRVQMYSLQNDGDSARCMSDKINWNS